MSEGTPHVYAHFPFCVQKCPYCDFNSHARRDAEAEGYVDALLHEARVRGAGVAPRTLYVGGGTPTHAEPALLERYLTGLRQTLGDRRLEEFTVEANPGGVTPAKARALRAAGVTRVSLGAQSFDARHLRTLGRLHAPESTAASVEMLRDVGIEHLSLDLILALPGQTPAEQVEDVECVLRLGPEHVSAYVLTYEEGTAFTRWMREGRLPAPDDEREAEYQELVTERLRRAGLLRYEVSNYARPGAECLHNLGYWRNASWLGLGAGAHGHQDGRRWKNLSDPARYATAVRERGLAEEWCEVADAPTRLFETLMMGLRLREGVDLVEAARSTGIDARACHAEVFARHVADGLLVWEGARIKPTARGLDFASHVARTLLPEPICLQEASSTVIPDRPESPAC